jgi:hypothetical protein
MSMKIKIEIKGLALCFLKPGADAWTVLFPCDQGVHDLWFNHAGLTAREKLHDPQNKDLRIVFNDVIEQEDPDRDDTDKIFNLNGLYAHAGNLIESRNKTRVDEIRMLVPYSELDGHDTSHANYFVQKQDYAGTPVVDIGEVSTKISLTFKINADLIMSLMDGATVLKTFNIAYQNRKSATLYFDNDCGRNCNHNDSLDVYEVVGDASDNDIKFASGKVTKHDGITKYRDVDTKSSPYGNCDPAWSDPPPG